MYLVLDEFIKICRSKLEKRELGLFLKQLKDLLYIIVIKLYEVKRHDSKTNKKMNKKYFRILNYTNKDKLEILIVQFKKMLNLYQELMKKNSQENLITQIKFAKLSKIEEIVLNLAYQIKEKTNFLKK